MQTQQSFPRTRQRLAEARQMIDAGCPTAAMILLRAALETAVVELFQHGGDRPSVVRIIVFGAGGTRETQKRVQKLMNVCNKAVHGAREASLAQAQHLMRLTEIVACRWLRRVQVDKLFATEGGAE